MNGPIVLVIVICCFLCTTNSIPYDYWKIRAEILTAEQNSMLGGQLDLKYDEYIANDFLMAKKRAEFENAFKNLSLFLPGRNFIEARTEIKNSEVYKIIRAMPKGAVLHAHDTALVSADWIFWNITFRPNLYVCESSKNLLQLRFFEKPNNDCSWKLLSDLRKNKSIVDTINSRIYKQMTMLTKNPEMIYKDSDKVWSKFKQIFEFITPMLSYKPVYEDHYYEALKDHYMDNIMYIEIRSTLPNLYELNGTVYSSLETAMVYKKTTERFMSDYPNFVGAKLIYAPNRKVDENKFDEYLTILKALKEKFPTFLAGFDLVGQEDKGQPLAVFANKLRNLNPSIDYFFHAGETGWYGSSTDENLIDAVLLGAKRIGHGYALTKHPLVMEIIKQRGIAVEVNPISNQVLNLVKDLRNHPAAQLFANNFPVIVSNDDPGLWGSNALSYDFYLAFMGIMSQNSDLRALKQLALNSIIYSNMDTEQKNYASILWKKKWCDFIDKVVNSSQARQI
ncbi:adenosine deaminase 2-like [Vespa crabro]|uniref:adenosine deaminase 2-like n=1 Tax=Vespa crabro TaxID=7445 RepID=UPI001F017D04|nr:adenosine deaminase 2-like [Vespa crabro]